MEEKHDLSARIWAGDDTTVAEARATYNRDGKTIPYAVAVYSARNWALRRLQFRRMKQLEKEFQPIATELIHLATVQLTQLSADECDVISTHLEWWSRMHRNKSRLYADDVLKVARKVCRRGLDIVGPARQTHTGSLLCLTNARIDMHAPPTTRAAVRVIKNRIVLAESFTGFVVDKNQKRRLYRKCAHLYLLLGQPVRAFSAFQKMRSVT